MTKKQKCGVLIGVAAFVAATVVFNLLPDGIRISATLASAAGAVVGWLAKMWYDAKTEE